MPSRQTSTNKADFLFSYTIEGMTVGAVLVFLGLLGPSVGYKSKGTLLYRCEDKERGVMPSGYNETTMVEIKTECIYWCKLRANDPIWYYGHITDGEECKKRKKPGRCRQGYCITGEHSSTRPDDSTNHELTTPRRPVTLLPSTPVVNHGSDESGRPVTLVPSAPVLNHGSDESGRPVTLVPSAPVLNHGSDESGSPVTLVPSTPVLNHASDESDNTVQITSLATPSSAAASLQ
ncbi:uncharacterized protein [Dermacentor albipictus]|uniref:uncharacterized protein isoform X2 n=1 Tax=Dermacentor albipictus TaxID=60249 RepID=UPI0031FBC397